MKVRRAVPGDEERLRDIRLEALTDSPDAFASTYEREASRSWDEWRQWIEPSPIFFAEGDGEPPDGLIGAFPDADEASVAWVVAVWVRPEQRGTGTGDALMRAIVEWGAAAGWAALRLHVVPGNEAARRLYERHGFRLTGDRIVREKDGVTELEMELRL